MERLHRLPVKTSSSNQGARPRGAIHRAGRPHAKKKAVRRSNGHKKVLQRSLDHHVKIAFLLQWWRMSTKIRLDFYGRLP